jgi:hypothetical protein
MPGRYHPSSRTRNLRPSERKAMGGRILPRHPDPIPPWQRSAQETDQPGSINRPSRPSIATRRIQPSQAYSYFLGSRRLGCIEGALSSMLINRAKSPQLTREAHR